MDKLFCNWSVVLGVLGGIASWAFGAWDIMIKVLLAVIILDYATGLIKGIYSKKLSSEISFKGLLKKVVILIIVALANLIQQLMGDNLAIRDIVITFYIANEGISILENATVIMPNMPQQLKDVLLQIRHNNDEDDKDDEVPK